MFYRRVGMDRFYLFTDYTVLEQLMENKFSIIDQFRTEAKNRELSLTLSMGFSYGDGNHDEIGRVACLTSTWLKFGVGIKLSSKKIMTT